MAKTFLPPHLIDVCGVSLCSACQHTFDTESQLSIGVAFRMHILDVHTAKPPRGLKQIEPNGPDATHAGIAQTRAQDRECLWYGS